MTTRAAAFAVGLAALLASASAALAGETAKAPTSLVLQKADFPSGTMFDLEDSDLSGFKPRLESGGVDYEAATTTAIGYSSAKGSLHVVTTVFVTPSVAMAKKAYKLLKPPGREPFWVARTPHAVAGYGDEQIARLKTAGGEGIWFVRMVVRKRATVWAFSVMSERRPALSKSEVLASFQRYATKQKARVGNG